MIFRRFCFLLLFPLIFLSSAPPSDPDRVVTVMFYNLENLYDTHDDTLHRDNEFLPTGERRWSSYRLHNKLTALSKVIINTGNWEPPAIIGVCEAENRQILEMLVKHPLLRQWNYQIIHKDSPDKRGIDVAALYRPDIFSPFTYRCFPPVEESEKVPSTREILYLGGTIISPDTPEERDTLHLFFNHWPSRYGGVMESRPLRIKAGGRVFTEITRLCQTHLNPRIIISGDFNDQPHDESLRHGLQAREKPRNHPDSLVNLSWQWRKSGKGTLKYQSQWFIFDQFIVTEALLDSSSGIYIRPPEARILNAPFLLEEDEKFTGNRLRRTYLGFRYQGGFSDHLPILVTLRKR